MKNTVMRFLRIASLGVLLFVTWSVAVMHLSVFTPPIPLSQSASPLENQSGIQSGIQSGFQPGIQPRIQTAIQGLWIPRADNGINHLVVRGSPYHRGVFAGRATAALLERQEAELSTHFESFFKNELIRNLLLVGVMRWFWGIEKYFEFEWVAEMQGQSESASSRWNHYADPLTRQFAYHGLHEVGQLFVDHNRNGAGCTAFALLDDHAWTIGRNFDFEGGRIFDEEKIVKWVFPDDGYAFVSVIWAGMVGVVTGVNERGVYISINAAGSKDFRRFGIPSTLVALKALQHSKNAEEAKEIIERSSVFITDIYLVADKHNAYRIEKSPKQVHSIRLQEASVIANHLHSPAWQGDANNEFRRVQLTSGARETRGMELIKNHKGSESSASQKILKMLRDKQGVGDRRLHIGHRSAIDALIATHSVIWNGKSEILYVSQGPSLVGIFRGYDLKRSFERRIPVEVAGFPEDHSVSLNQYHGLKRSLASLVEIGKLVQRGHCQAASEKLRETPLIQHNEFFLMKGRVSDCFNNTLEAREAYAEARALVPPYEADRKAIELRLAP